MLLLSNLRPVRIISPCRRCDVCGLDAGEMTSRVSARSHVAGNTSTHASRSILGSYNITLPQPNTIKSKLLQEISIRGASFNKLQVYIYDKSNDRMVSSSEPVVN